DLAGYLYVVLNSKVAESVTSQLSGSHVVQVSLVAAFCLLLLVVVLLALVFQRITRPLRELSGDINAFQQSDWMSGSLAGGAVAPEAARNNSEIDVLSRNFAAMKQRIQAQFSHLQENSRLRRELISNISHDLRTPLASLQGYLEALYLKRDSLSEEEQQKYLGVAHRNSRRLATLITELFELSKLEAGKVKPELEAFSLLELVYDVVQDYELAAAERQVQLKIQAEGTGYFVEADIGLIQRVLQNLIDNALRFTPSGGEIEIRLFRYQDKTRVTVADTGLGISEADLPHVFDAYYSTRHKAEVADSEDSRGTGLGLAIVKRILELHNASINVQSRPGTGTLFQFELDFA
ncbi:MAG: HAMP domain-containing sensor histidine kinase, partial [Ketobacteraceae bacterium]|nr:HAMP domain-containing sensor histidine kinase [Ketobacteraceae bacterium]